MFKFKYVALISLVVLAVGCSSDNNSSPKTPPPASSGDNGGGNNSTGNSGTTGSPQAAPKFAELEGVLVKDTKHDYQITVLDAQKLARLARDNKKFAVEGTIYDSRYLTSSDRDVIGKIFCAFMNLEGAAVSENDLAAQSFTVEWSKEETQSSYRGSNRSISITFNEIGIGFGCTKSSQTYSDFTWYEIQTALEGIVKIELIPEAAPVDTSSTPKVATDADGYCTEDLQSEMKKVASESMGFAKTVLDLAVKIMTAPSEGEKARYQREMRQEGRKMVQMCDRFESEWGEFTCKTKNDDGTEIVNKSSDMKQSCDQARAQLQ